MSETIRADGAEFDYRLRAAEVMKLQAEAISIAADRIDGASFGSAVDLLLRAPGKAVTSGAGTSGLIARKIAATLTSTGTPAVFLHPSDALHGALGIVTSDDVAIIVSNGGESDELLAFLPYLQRRSVPLVAIVGNIRSTLARHADVVLDAFAGQEACPLNLAPTTSTSVALALGDALAMTLMQCKGITAEAFARNHPSGRLGKRLTLRVSDLMHSDDPRPVVGAGHSFLDVVTAISASGLGAVTVESDDGRLIGIITDGDLRRAFEKSATRNVLELCAADFMTRDPVTVAPDLLAYATMQLMEDRPSQISVLPVVTPEQRCVGIVRLHDLVRSGL